MEQSFSAAVAEWRDFYSYLGTAAFTLAGLLFVAITLRLEMFTQPRIVDVCDFSYLTLACFLANGLIALLFLVPDQSRIGLGLPLAIIGALGLIASAFVAPEMWGMARDGIGNPLPWWTWLYATSIVATFAGLAIDGVALLDGRTRALNWLVAVDVSLLLIGCANTVALISHARPASDHGGSLGSGTGGIRTRAARTPAPAPGASPRRRGSGGG
jgi:hypothetical protein